jgi:hypothetical protein
VVPNGVLEILSLTPRENLLSLACGPKLASLLVGSLVALRDLFPVVVKGRSSGGPSRFWLLVLLRHG